MTRPSVAGVFNGVGGLAGGEGSVTGAPDLRYSARSRVSQKTPCRHSCVSGDDFREGQINTIQTFGPEEVSVSLQTPRVFWRLTFAIHKHNGNVSLPLLNRVHDAAGKQA